MDKNVFELVKLLAEQHDVSQAKIAEMLVDTITRIYNKQKPDEQIEVNIDLDKNEIVSKKILTVIEDLPDGEYDDFIEIPLREAKEFGNFKPGDICEVPFNIFEFFKNNEVIMIMQIFKQRLNEINNEKVYKLWSPRIGEIVNCQVEKFDKAKNFYFIDLADGNIGFVSRSESIPGETLTPGQRYKFLVKDVKEQSKGWPIILSRGDVDFVIKLLELEVPELASGEIIINKAERIPGFKTKIAVSSAGGSFDPCGLVVGPKGSRVKAVSDQINGEKIEVIKYSEDPKEFLVNACGSKNIVGFNYAPSTMEGEQAYATIIANDDLLPVIIGKKGFNIKLISKLLNCGIDINTPQEAAQHGIQYEPVTVQQRSFGFKPRQNFDSFSRPSKPSNSHSPDSILDDIANMSQEELEAKFNVVLKKDELENGESSVNMESLLRENNMNDDDFDIGSYEDMELSDAFADEIAAIKGNKDK
ncbi:MAG: transcription termination factor NusA [Mycoplasma sp.]